MPAKIVQIRLHGPYRARKKCWQRRAAGILPAVEIGLRTPRRGVPTNSQLRAYWSSVHGMCLPAGYGRNAWPHASASLTQRSRVAELGKARSPLRAGVGHANPTLSRPKPCRPRPHGRGYAHLQCCSGGLCPPGSVAPHIAGLSCCTHAGEKHRAFAERRYRSELARP